MLKRFDPHSSYPLSSENFQKLKLLQKLTASGRSRLPDDIAIHFWVANFDENTLNIITDDASYVTYLRAHQGEIIKQLNEEFTYETAFHWRRINIRVSREKLTSAE